MYESPRIEGDIFVIKGSSMANRKEKLFAKLGDETHDNQPSISDFQSTYNTISARAAHQHPSQRVRGTELVFDRIKLCNHKEFESQSPFTPPLF